MSKLQPRNPHETQSIPENRNGTRTHREYTRFLLGGEDAIGRTARIWERASPRLIARARKVAMNDGEAMPARKTPRLRRLVVTMIGRNEPRYF